MMPRLISNALLIASAAALMDGSFVLALQPPSTEPLQAGSAIIPADARFACPMPAHPDEPRPADRGPYFSSEPGRCPRCGMALKPIDGLAWAKAAKAAEGAEAAYTCPDHQTVFSKEPGVCPRCGKPLQPFKVMYTCPDREHAGVIEASAGRCPKCGKPLAPFRGIWLDESMAAANVPPTTQPATGVEYRCLIHPLVHSQSPGRCTICARELMLSGIPQTEQVPEGMPAGTRYACPMRKCQTFSAEPGECPKCGMKLKPIEEVDWTRALSASSRPAAAKAAFVCPMHRWVASDQPGTCPICEMQLARTDQLNEPQTPPERVRQQVDHITEHYLAIQRLLASDNISNLPQQVLGIASASEELLHRMGDAGLDRADEVKAAAERLRSAAIKMNGQQISEVRAQFADLSSTVIELLKQVRPERTRWNKLYIFHCPMSKGDWVQADREIRNPYYGFDMLKCGELKSTE